MKQKKDRRAELLTALVNYANQSGSLNPHFYKDEMINILAISEADFNIIQKQLGDEYCHFVDNHEGKSRYAISVNKCLVLRDQIEQGNTAVKSHEESIRVNVLCTILGSLLGFFLGRCSI